MMLMADALDTPGVALAISGIGGAVTTLAGFWLKGRLASGTVATSTASELWTEVDRHLKRLDAEVTSQRAEIVRLRMELMQRDEKILHLEGERERLTARVSTLELELAKVNERATAAAAALAKKDGDAA